ncbi:MAG: hypothetical protein ACI35O_03105 [Bacillaceae bacterium]
MKDFRFLKLLDYFQALFSRIHVDYPILRQILQLKLTMDNRRPSTIMNTSAQPTKESNSNFFKSLLFYLITGIFLSFLLFFNANLMLSMSMIFGITMFLITMAFISDFSSVLLDVKDTHILHTKPINQRTIGVAKLIHICYYMFFISLSIAGPTLIVGTMKIGIHFFLLFTLTLFFINIFILVITALLYLVILKVFNGEKLKDMITYVQIIFTFVLIIGYQFVGRLFVFFDNEFVFNAAWWQYFLPPIWFAAPFEVIITGNRQPMFFGLVALAVFIPLLLLLAYIRLLPTFERNLQKLTNQSDTLKKQSNKKRFLERFLCRNKEEQAFYSFAMSMFKHERDFKLKIYPTLGMAIFFPLLFLYNSFASGFDLTHDHNLFFNIYFCGLFIPTIVYMISYTSKYKGAFIFKTAPIDSVSSIYHGTFKAMFVRFILPIFFIEAIVFLYLFGFGITLDLVALFVNLLLMVALAFKQIEHHLPFSKPINTMSNKQGFRFFIILMQWGLLVLIHFGARQVPFGIYGYLLLLILVTSFAWKKAFQVSWEQITL